MTQLTLDLSLCAALGRSDFLASDSNAAAAGWIDRWPDWPSAALVLHGPPGCGKTHLVHLWRERASAVILPGEALEEGTLSRLLAVSRHRIAVDDADRAPERALLHLYNSVLEQRGSLLITARQPPGAWQTELGDLRSRLRAAFAVGIGAPDDALLGNLLVKHFADRQLRVAPEVIAYLIGRMERSSAAAAAVAARLDALALTGGGPVTVPLARKVLAERGDQSLSPGSESGVT
jgi:chromosomal replication initiation ATPase DnaA